MRSYLRIAVLGLIMTSTVSSQSQNSVAHTWIDVNLESVRRDFAKPVVHARNLWHTSVAMYDAWAVYDDLADPYFLGKSLGDYECAFDGVPAPPNAQAAQEQAMSYAAYRMLRHRYANSPGNASIFFMLDTTMLGLGYNKDYINTDYINGGPGALGNYIAQELIAAGLVDGSNESSTYENQHYIPVNEPLLIDSAHFIGNPDIDSLNRWQPLSLTLFCDQAGNTFDITPEFLGAEWGNVVPFALADSVKTVRTRDGDPYEWTVYHDPGAPPYIGLEGDQQTELYRWGMDLVAKWSSFLDPADPALIDISPASLGNIPLDELPTDFSEFEQFYNRDTGGDPGVGYDVNPSTGMPYEPQIVKRGDYARILAEFWADGPDSETPPGHWFDIYNEVSLHPEFTTDWNGDETVSQLEYDIKAYFTLGGAMHDAAIAAWSVKGFYDYIRPVSAIRGMAELGQSSDPGLPNYHPAGLELEPGFIEYVQLGDTIYEGDTILVAEAEHVDMLKMKCWIGPLVEDTCISGFAPEYQTEVAGVGWKFALDFWPYQRPTFVTPPFAGYVSGHSTFSRAAAEVMTLITGDAYFPGGMGEFHCPQDQYLVFEDGPSEDITLQWATYQDASDQCSLSRIYGGIHPPADDIPGRLMGYEIGHNTFELAEKYFNGGIPRIETISFSDDLITDADDGDAITITIEYNQRMDDSLEPQIISAQGEDTFTPGTSGWISDTEYELVLNITDGDEFSPQVDLTVSGARSLNGVDQNDYVASNVLYIDMLNPTATAVVDDSDGSFVTIDLTFDEPMDMAVAPSIAFPMENPIPNDIMLNVGLSMWLSPFEYQAYYDVLADAQLSDIDIQVSLAEDSVGNPMNGIELADQFSVDQRMPSAIMADSNEEVLFSGSAGSGNLLLTFTYDEEMDQSTTPTVTFTMDDPLANSLTLNAGMSEWTSGTEYVFAYDVVDANETLAAIDVELSGALDLNGLEQNTAPFAAVFEIDSEEPVGALLTSSDPLITDLDDGTTWSFTVEFNEEMDETQMPAFFYPDEDPGATLTFASGAWLSPLTYEVTLDVADMGLDLLDVDLGLMTAFDVAGNELAMPLSLVDIVDIEMANPLAMDFSASHTLITDANDSEEFVIDFSTTEPMDETEDLMFEFQGADLTNTMLQSSGSWLDPQNYQASFTITDDQIDGAAIVIVVSGGKDLVGNEMPDFNALDVFDIDMLNPMATMATPSNDPVDNTLIGADGFSIEVEFSEEVDQTITPTLSFPIEDPSATLSISANSDWVNSSAYRFDFDVTAEGNAVADIDIEVANVFDLLGNPIEMGTVLDVFSIDVASGLSDFSDSDVLHVYPNPVSAGQDIIVSLTNSQSMGTLSLIDPLGRIVDRRQLQLNEGDIVSIPTTGLSAGLYSVRFENAESQTSFKVVIKD